MKISIRQKAAIPMKGRKAHDSGKLIYGRFAMV